MHLPDSVQLIEVGLRDGLQNESTIISTDEKIQIIEQLIHAGVTAIQATSFVHPERVPQMADAESLCQRLPKGDPVIFSGLVLNMRGLERAYAAGLKKVDIGISASNTHSLKNTGKAIAEKLPELQEMVRQAKEWGLTVRGSLQCVFGCVYEGKISETHIGNLVEYYLKWDIDELGLADSTGMANPLLIKSVLSMLQPTIGNIPVILHLHDTYGLGLANLVSALEMGIRRFDTAFGGMGGCPFIPGAAGNIATEDTIYLLESLGIQTHINRLEVAEISRQLEHKVGYRLAGKLYRIN